MPPAHDACDRPVAGTAVTRRQVGVVVTLLGLLLLLAALSAYGLTVYSESATDCGSLAAARPQDTAYPVCVEAGRARQRLVLALTCAGLLAALIGAVDAARHRRCGPPPPRPAHLFPLDAVRRRQALVGAGVAAGLVFALRFVGELLRPVPGVHTGLPGGWVHLFGALAAVSACLLVASVGFAERRLTLEHALGAGAVGLPLAVSAAATLNSLPWPWPRPNPGATLAPCCNDLWKGWVWVPGSFLLLGVTLALAVLLQRSGRSAPSLTTSAGLIVFSSLVGTHVFVPDLVAVWVDDAPGPPPLPGRELWLPLLLLPVCASAAAIARAGLRREPR